MALDTQGGNRTGWTLPVDIFRGGVPRLPPVSGLHFVDVDGDMPLEGLGRGIDPSHTVGSEVWGRNSHRMRSVLSTVRLNILPSYVLFGLGSHDFWEIFGLWSKRRSIFAPPRQKKLGCIREYIRGRYLVWHRNLFDHQCTCVPCEPVGTAHGLFHKLEIITWNMECRPSVAQKHRF